MFTSFDENAFREAIRKKDLPRLKVNTMSAIRNDPTFERDETATVIRILEEEIPEIFEPEITLDYEERPERSQWDKAYFTKLTYWFQENFAKSRIDHIKEVGQAVHQDTAQAYRESMRGPSPNPPKAPENKRRIALAVTIAAAAALVLLVTLLLKLLRG